MIRVGIVNDLALAAEALRRAVAAIPDHTVCWVARDGREAIARATAERPDAVLMDLVMPQMDGVACTREMMRIAPCPILITTATRTGNFDLVFQAMSAGALDAVDTPRLDPSGALVGLDEFTAKLRRVHGMTSRTATLPEQVFRRPAAPPTGKPPLVLIGASTGGPKAVAQVLASLRTRRDLAIILVQHVDRHFSAGLATWLETESRFPVRPAEDGVTPEGGVALLAASNDHLTMTSRGALRYTREPIDYPYRPSVDVLFRSVAAMWGESGSAALLTGMGQDGAIGLRALKEAGWRTLAQDEATSVVWGMPQAAVKLGAAQFVLPIDEIGPMLLRGFPRAGSSSA